MSETTKTETPGQAYVVPSPSAAWVAAPAPLLALLLGLLALRFWVAGHMDFEADEAYYWLWSRHLAASYYDHPPMVAYLIRLGTALLGHTILGVRIMAIVAMMLASALIYALALILFNERRIGLLAVLWFSVAPPAAVFSAVLSPDAPAMAFWLLCCVGLGLVWRSGRGEWWYLAGVAMGLLLLSKYTGVFLMVGIAAWLLASAEMRRWLARREPYLAGLIALVLFSPVIVWNAQHGWASFAKQFGRALDTSADGGLANMAAFVGTQATFVSPLIFAFAITGLGVALMRGLRRHQANWLLLALTSLPILIYFLAHAFMAEVQTQWPSAAYPAAIVAAVAAFAARTDDVADRPLVRVGFRAAPWLGLLSTIALCEQMTLALAPVPAARDPLSRFAGWAELAAGTRTVAAAQHASYIATDDYGIDGVLSFYLQGVTVFQTSEAIRYGSMPQIDQAVLARATGIYLASPGANEVARLQKHFDQVEPISTIWRSRRGDPIEPYGVYVLKGYRGGLPY